MPMPFSYAATFIGIAWLDDLLSAIAANIQAKCGLPADLVFISLADDETHMDCPPGDRFVVVRPTDFPAAPGQMGGGRGVLSGGTLVPGTTMIGSVGTFRVSMFTRYASDQEFRDALKLLDKTKGILAALKKVIDAMANFIPLVAGTSNAMTRQPMEFKSFGIQPSNLKRGNWVVVPCYFEAIFNFPLTA